jgi:hypothetical protein
MKAAESWRSYHGVISSIHRKLASIKRNENNESVMAAHQRNGLGSAISGENQWRNIEEMAKINNAPSIA